MPDNSPTDDAQPAISGALTSAHTGLRGLVAIYILVFHAVIFSLGWNLQGSALMPVFFLLSGYSLALGYGAGETLPLGRFFRNRVARIAPVYYVCMVVAIPPALASQSWVPPGLTWWVLATNTPMVQMWSGLPPLSFAGPAWTVSTLFFFYLCFPLVLRFHRRHSYGQLRRWLLGLFVAQAVIFFGISFGLGGSDPEWGFWASHAWPVSRLAVFDMGVVAGLMVLKRADAEMGGGRFMGTAAADRSAWARRTDRRAAVFAVLILGLSTAAVLGRDLMGSWWIQGIFPYLMLQVIAGLSFSSGASCTVRLLTSAPFLWLGRIGFSLYLIHEVVIYYVKWVIRPDQPLFFAVLPVWSIGLVIPLSLAAAAILFHAVERPGRAWLRGRRFSRREGVRRTDSS